MELSSSTSVPQADEIIRTAISAIEAQLKSRVRGYYLTGRYAEHSVAGSFSDIDLFIVLKAEFTSPEERDITVRIAQESASKGSIRLHSFATCESELSKLHPVIQVALKSGSLLMYGEDIRKHIPTPPIEVYTRAVCEGAVQFIGPILRNSENLKLPLAYPHPDELFYGYDHKRILSWYPRR